jgi:hypothetical protein
VYRPPPPSHPELETPLPPPPPKFFPTLDVALTVPGSAGLASFFVLNIFLAGDQAQEAGQRKLLVDQFPGEIVLSLEPIAVSVCVCEWCLCFLNILGRMAVSPNTSTYIHTAARQWGSICLIRNSMVTFLSKSEDKTEELDAPRSMRLFRREVLNCS